jgi:PAS domain S-box-containing protein
MSNSFSLWACVAVGLFELALGALGYASYRNTGKLLSTGEGVAHGHTVIEQTELVEDLLADAEAHECKYVLTGDRHQLELCRASLERLDRARARLDALTHDEPEEHHNVEELAGPLDRKEKELEDVIRLRGEGDFDAARARLVQDEAREGRDEVARVTATLKEAEQKVLGRRQAEASITADETRGTIIVGNGLLLAVLSLGGVALFGEARGRRLGEQRYRRLVELCPDAILIVRGGRVVFANSACFKLLGATEQQLVGRSPDDLIHPDSRPAVRSRIDEAVATGRPSSAPLEAKVMTLQGTPLDVEVAVSPFAEQGGTAAQVVLHDVTERKRLEARFFRAQRLESLGTLAGGIAHDLNNVLTPILMGLKLLQKDRTAAQRQELLSTALASAERGAEMVRQLLSFAGGVEGPREPLHLKPVVREVQTLLTHTLPKSVRIRVDLPPDLWLVAGDQTQLTQVLLNLCVNARDAMPQGGTLTLSAANAHVGEQLARNNDGARPGPHVLLIVSDTGTGIAPEILDKIFNPFFTTKEQGKGTGLGLSTVLGIVRSHGGFVNVASEVGQGSRFSVYLPALEQFAATPVPEDRTDLPRGQGELILVIDDEEPILLMARAMLETHGYRTLTASRGAEGIELYRKSGEVRAVILDMMMPGLDGPATMRKILEINPKARIIAASGLKATGRVAEAVAEGARAFLQKPYTDEQLLWALAEILRSSGEHVPAPPA